jgi:hypothetical protein
MSHDIVDKFRRPRGRSQGLIVASGVERELADERAVLADDADVLVGHEQVDGKASVGGP